MKTSFAQAVHAAAERPEIRIAICQVYESLQERIDVRRPVCRTSGRCCHFDAYGHRLYVTTAEMAMFIHDLPVKPAALPGALPVLRSCPYQIDGLCSVHAIRPFGCRIFFCDETSTVWQREQYELFHQQIKQIHQQYGIPYFYLEWRQALAELR